MTALGRAGRLSPAALLTTLLTALLTALTTTGTGCPRVVTALLGRRRSSRRPAGRRRSLRRRHAGSC